MTRTRHDVILDSMRTQFTAKIMNVMLPSGAIATTAQLNDLLRDVARNVEHALVWEAESVATHACHSCEQLDTEPHLADCPYREHLVKLAR